MPSLSFSWASIPSLASRVVVLDLEHKQKRARKDVPHSSYYALMCKTCGFLLKFQKKLMRRKIEDQIKNMTKIEDHKINK